MTGVNINKIRHYAPGFNSRTTRLDADAAALTFKAGNKIISTSERLIADVSVKVAMPTSPNTDGKKRGLEKGTNYKNINGVVYDPDATKKEGQYFKHYVTESERIEALRSPDPVPNWGWMDRNAPTNSLPKPKTAVAKVTRYPVNPKTGEPMKSQGFEPEIKSLGKTIGERNPAGKLAARAARAMGLVIDSLGKFRCPPGTPAANRFTNERGEGCFGISASQIQNIASSLSNIMSAPGNRSRVTESLMNIGVSAYEIRKAYKENGIDGLRSLASRAGIGEGLVGDAGEDDPSYVSSVVARVRDVMDATRGAEARMNRVRDEKNKVINDLKTKYGITEPDEYLALGEIFRAMSEDPDAPFSSGQSEDPDAPSLPGQFEKLFMGGSPEEHEKWVIDTTVEMHLDAIRRKTGLLDKDAIIAAYEEAKRDGIPDTITNFIDAAIEREKKFRIGAFKQILVEASKNPETFKTENGKPFEIYVDFGYFVDSKGRSNFDFEGLGGVARPTDIYIGSGPAIQGYREGPGPGYMDLYEATGGDIDDQWRAITEAMSGDEKSRRWVETYSTDLAAEAGNGWEDFGAQVGAHEMTHKKQYDAVFEWFKLSYPDENFDALTNSELMSVVQEFIDTASDENIAQVFGISFNDLIDRRLDALAGQYSQVKQQEALGVLADTRNPRAFNQARNLAFFETHAELVANREVGLIGDNPEVDEVLDAFLPEKEIEIIDSVPPSPSGLIIPGSTSPHWGPLIVPGAPPVPDGDLIIPGRRPDAPIDSPKPVKPKRPITPGVLVEPTLPEGAGVIKTPRRPSAPTGRTPRGPVDPFEKDRHGKVPRMIKEERFTNQDIEEHLYGEDGKGGLWGMFRSARNMRIRKGHRLRDTQKKELLNNLVDTMGMSFEELEEIGQKAQRGENITPEEKRKLMSAITHLRNGANEFKIKSEEARRRYEERRQQGNTSTTDTYDDISEFRADLEQIQEEIEMYESLFQRVGRGFAPAVHDILTIVENGPYPDRLGASVGRNALRKSSQEARLSAEEIEAIDFVSDNPPISYLASRSAPDLEFELESNAEVLSAFRRHGITPPDSVTDSDIDSASPAMQALEKTVIEEDIVVEIEIDSIADTEPGSMYSIPSIQSAKIMGEEQDDRGGLASFTPSGSMTATAVGRMLGSRTGRKLIERVGVNPEQADVVQLIGEMAIGFSAGGPAGAIVPLARRGGRDAGEKALEVMVERGMIDQSVADKIIKHGLNRIASEGLPDEIIQAAEATRDRLLTEENRRKALEMGSAFQERSLELAEATREKVSELTESARGQAFEIAGSARERLRRRREGREKPDAVGPGASAGWSPDPSKPGQFRYFNGQVWTEHVSDSSGNQSVDNNPALANQPGWSEYQTGLLASRSGGSLNDPFAEETVPAAFSSPSISDPFEDYSPEAPSVPSVPYSDPFEDMFEESGRTGLASSSAARRSGKKITKKFRVDSKPREKPKTRQELISRAIPTNTSELLSILKESPFTQGKKSEQEILDLINIMEIDWEAQSRLNAKLDKTLNDSPGFEELLGEFDIPPMIVTKNGAAPGRFNREQMYQDPYRWESIEGEYFPEYGFLAFPPRVVNQEEVVSKAVDWPIPTDDILRHELSHTIHAMAMGKNRKARKKYEQDTAEQIDRLEEAISYAERNGIEKIDLINYSLSAEDQELAGEISRYAMTKKSEYIAELMTYMFPGKKTKFFMPKEEHFKMLSEFLDVPIEQLKQLHYKSSDIKFL
jgi:hypothetical protein